LLLINRLTLMNIFVIFFTQSPHARRKVSRLIKVRGIKPGFILKIVGVITVGGMC
jgi:hypothetical protein